MSESMSELINHIYDAALDDTALRRLPAEFAAAANGRSCLILRPSKVKPHIL